MKQRLAVTAVVVVLISRWWVLQGPDAPAAIPSLAQRAQVFLLAHNLTDAIGLAEFIGNGSLPRPGLRKEAPKEKRHPVVIVPGIISCGLEVWKAHPCLGEGFFRRRVWGDVSMAEAIISNWSCWLQHISPDPVTGLDREGIEVRAARGLRSADYFVGSYWLWAKMIRNLADIGYVEEDILMACFDWRLAFPLLEQRDRYLSGLRHDVEKLVARTGEKAVVLGHSMGANLFFYFMNWVERQAPGWVDRHIASFVNIAGALLGAMGPLAAFLSGEMDATAALGPLNNYIEALALTYDQMRDVYWSMGGVGALLPTGGSAVWGSSASGWTDSPVDVVEFDPQFDGAQSLEELYARVEARKDLPLHGYPSWSSYERGVVKPAEAGAPGADDPRRFGNPLASALPEAPNLKIFCFYGTGLPTERGYRYSYRQVRWAFDDADFLPETRLLRWSSTRPLDEALEDLRKYLGTQDAKRPIKLDAVGSSLTWPSLAAAIPQLEKIREGGENPEQWIRINSGFHSNGTQGPWGNGVDGRYLYGVSKTDGDSTVPLVSLGYMCKYGWRELREFNPGNVTVWSKEFKHEPLSMLLDSRGGPAAAKHVEIIGNHALIADVLKIVAGETKELEKDRIFSNLTQIGPLITERLRRIL